MWEYKQEWLKDDFESCSWGETIGGVNFGDEILFRGGEM